MTYLYFLKRTVVNAQVYAQGMIGSFENGLATSLISKEKARAATTEERDAFLEPLEDPQDKSVSFADITGDPTDNEALSDALGNVEGSVPYLVYRALLTQSGTDAPEAVVLENTLGGTVVWTRSIAGTYIGTLTGAFPTAKTFLKQSAFSYISGPADDDVLFAVQPNTVNSVSVLTMTGATSAGVDAYLTNTPVEIIVYP